MRSPLGANPRRAGLRAKVVIASVLVLAMSALASVLVVRALLLTQLHDQIRRSLVKEVGEFLSVFERVSNGDRPGSLAAVFDTYMEQNIPSEGEEVLAIIDGEPYLSERAHDAGFPLQQLRTQVSDWNALDVRQQGIVSTPVGDLRFIAQPVENASGRRGILVIANSPDFEVGEIDDVTRLMTIVGITVVGAGSILSWVAAGRVVAPIARLTRAARSVGESDLSRRIEVEGHDEVAVLARTFNGMLDRLEAAFRTQGEFLDDAGHELRTPITIIRGHLELIGDDPDERAETMGLVMGELDRMDGLVSDLLLLTNAERPDFIRLEPVDLAELTSEILANARAISDRDWRAEASAEGRYLLDPRRVTQAMMQLAANAASHTASGPISIGSSAGSEGLRLWVRDVGPGIDPAGQRRIFQRFGRGDGPRRSEGSGLGLAIVKAIAEAHGGTAIVESAPGRGSTFSIVLPAVHAGDDETVPPEPSPHPVRA